MTWTENVGGESSFSERRTPWSSEANYKAKNACRQRHSIHVGLFTGMVIVMVQLCRFLWYVLSVMCILLDMMSLCSSKGVGVVTLKGKVQIIVGSRPLCAALINPSLLERPLFFKVGWTLSIFVWPFLGRRPHSLIGSGIWPEPAGLSVTVPAPLYVE